MLGVVGGGCYSVSHLMCSLVCVPLTHFTEICIRERLCVLERRVGASAPVLIFWHLKVQAFMPKVAKVFFFFLFILYIYFFFPL